MSAEEIKELIAVLKYQYDPSGLQKFQQGTQMARQAAFTLSAALGGAVAWGSKMTLSFEQQKMQLQAFIGVANAAKLEDKFKKIQAATDGLFNSEKMRSAVAGVARYDNNFARLGKTMEYAVKTSRMYGRSVFEIMDAFSSAAKKADVSKLISIGIVDARHIDEFRKTVVGFGAMVESERWDFLQKYFHLTTEQIKLADKAMNGMTANLFRFLNLRLEFAKMFEERYGGAISNILVVMRKVSQYVIDTPQLTRYFGILLTGVVTLGGLSMAILTANRMVMLLRASFGLLSIASLLGFGKLLLIAGAVTALVIVIDELWQTFQGKDTLLRDIFNSEVIQDAKTDVIDFGKTLSSIFNGPKKGLGEMETWLKKNETAWDRWYFFIERKVDQLESKLLKILKKTKDPAAGDIEKYGLIGGSAVAMGRAVDTNVRGLLNFTQPVADGLLKTANDSAWFAGVMLQNKINNLNTAALDLDPTGGRYDVMKNSKIKHLPSDKISGTVTDINGQKYSTQFHNNKFLDFITQKSIINLDFTNIAKQINGLGMLLNDQVTVNQNPLTNNRFLNFPPSFIQNNQNQPLNGAVTHITVNLDGININSVTQAGDTEDIKTLVQEAVSDGINNAIDDAMSNNRSQ